MKKYFIHIFVAILILSSAFPTISVSALSNPRIIEPEPQILRDEQIQLESELTEEVKLRFQNRTEPIEERVQVAPTAEQIAQTQAQVQSIFDCNTVTDVPKTECEALVALYISTNGADWSDNDYWLTAGEVENWDGVEVGAEHVISIVLPSNNLTGTIPAALGTLTNLGYLDLEGNELSGIIPPDLGNLTLLIHLYLDDNLLTGKIPPELGKLTNLQSLFLPQNQLTGSIPPELGNMTNLLYLFLEDNQLSGSIPAKLSEMSNLRTLGLANNQLTGGIPIELDKLTNLAYLSLSQNQLTGSIPLSFKELTNLEQFYFIGTHLCQPEDGLFQTWKDTVTDWQGTIFICISTSYCAGGTGIPVIECEALVALYNSTSGPEWVGVSIPWFTTPAVSSWGGVTVTGSNVTALNLSGNNLTGSIPGQLGNLTSLVELSLIMNQLSGRIPPQLGNLTSLENLSLGANQLTGSIPTDLGKLTNLEFLDLTFNKLSGSIPSQLGNLKSLVELWLGSNQLTGNIPTEFGDLATLQDLDLSYNPLSGSIPLSFVDLDSLEVFYFDATNLCEPADETFQTLMNDPVLDWSGTGLPCHAPVAIAEEYSTPEDSELVVPVMEGVLVNDSDADGDALTAELVANVANGSLVLVADGSFTYTPDPDFNGEDSFTYKVFDSVEYSELATVIITVNPVNDTPVANGQTRETGEDTPLAITLTGSDVDGDILSFSVITQPRHGALSGTVPLLTYTPEIDYYGSDSFTFKAYDGDLYSEVITVTIMVNQMFYSIYLPLIIK